MKEEIIQASSQKETKQHTLTEEQPTQRITAKLLSFIILNDQSPSVVNNVGLCCLP